MNTLTILFIAVPALLIIVLIVALLQNKSSLSRKNQNLEDDINELTKQLRDKSQEAENLTSQNIQLRESYSAANASIEALKGQITNSAATANKLQETNQELQREHSLCLQKLAIATEQLRQAQTDNAALTARQQELQKQSEETFKNLANEILKQNSRDFKESNETRINEILTPFKENINHIRQTIKDYYEQGLKETSSLKTTIAELTKLNNQLGKEANELTLALRGNKKNTQGPWGEMILTQILEGSGLAENTNYILQATKNADGTKIEENYRPDALLLLPEKKVIVIDSKVNITHFINYANAENEDDRKLHLKQHIDSMKTQIKSLSEKGYQKAVKHSADFVIMFVPNESAYVAAMQGDPNLWNEAYNKQVVMVSPTNLISVVKMMEQLWNNDKQNRNAIAIAEESGKLIDKLVGFAEDLQKVGDALNGARNAYDSAKNKLSDGRGNILGRAEKIRNLGAKATKSLPQHYSESDE